MKPDLAATVLSVYLEAHRTEMLFSQREALKVAIDVLDENAILHEKCAAYHAAATSNKNLLDIAWKRIEELEAALTSEQLNSARLDAELAAAWGIAE